MGNKSNGFKWQTMGGSMGIKAKYKKNKIMDQYQESNQIPKNATVKWLLQGTE